MWRATLKGLLAHKVQEELRRDWMARAGAMLMLPALRRLKAEIDWEEYGAAPLLGVNGVTQFPAVSIPLSAGWRAWSY